ncbi:MAG: GIY-YIG nuclease family protein [Planctomycetes bacterium]|jgi:predicted GIY-YIG superfamily endonuclease|nr:GIY-YIG nuclease family protein [Planctomycetota bacterium]
MYKLYILLCCDLSFYAGHTLNLKQRLKQHNNGEVKATKNKRPLKLIFYENFKTKREAMNREQQIKGWSRIKKINLIKFGHPTKTNIK